MPIAQAFPQGAQGGGGATNPTISSSLGNVEDQTGAYAPTLTLSSGASVLTTASNTATGSVTVTGSTTVTPSIPEPPAGSITTVIHTATKDGINTALTFSVGKAGAGAAFWTLAKSLDLTAMTPTSLVAGSQTVDGETIYCDGVNNVIDASGLTVGSGGATVAYVTMDTYMTDMNRPFFVQVACDVVWNGTGASSTIRIRPAFTDTAGRGPSIQHVLDVNSTNLDTQVSFQDGGTGNTGTFGAAAGVLYIGKPSTIVANGLFIGNQCYMWLTETVIAPGTIASMMAPAPGKIRVSYLKESANNSPIWSTLISGVYRDVNSVPTMTLINVYEGN